MTEADIEIILERAKELHPEAKPRIISDNGPQFIAKNFKEFIRISGMTHVRTSPYYPQSVGWVTRFRATLREDPLHGPNRRGLAAATPTVWSLRVKLATLQSHPKSPLPLGNDFV